MNEFYEQAFSTLYDGHDATKDCFVRDIRSRLSSENFKTVFAYICFKSYFKGQFEFSESNLCSYIEQAQKKFPELSFSIADFKVDLTQSICMMIREGLHYRFIHRSFQEYFAAWYTCKLTDDIQSKLLTHWLSESNIYTADGYLRSLFTLQPDKVNKIVFYPGIKKLKELYDKNGFGYDVICSIFNGINIFVPQGKKHRPRIGFSVQNRYLCNILYLTCGLNNYSSSDANSNTSKEDRVIDKLAATIPDESFSHTWSFEDLKKISADCSEGSWTSVAYNIWFAFQTDDGDELAAQVFLWWSKRGGKSYEPFQCVRKWEFVNELCSTGQRTLSNGRW